MLTKRRRKNSEELEGLQFHRGYQQTVLENNFSSYELTSQIEMTCRDRTGEFMSTVKNMQGRLENGFMSPKKKHGRDAQEWRYFMDNARQIGKTISDTFAKLEKLTILAKRKSLFDDKPIEIQELTFIIKHDINALNDRIAQLQEIARAKYSNHGKHMKSHSNSVVVLLQSKLALMSSDFKQVLERRTENLKHQKERQEQFSKGSVSSALPASVSGHNGSVLLFEDQAHNGEVAITMDGVHELGNDQKMLLVDKQDEYIQDRADTMQNIEATIVELGTIFQQLACMVKEQEEMVQRIDSNIEESQINIEAAHSEILKYFQTVTSNRWLILKVFAALLVCFVVFVVIIA